MSQDVRNEVVVRHGICWRQTTQSFDSYTQYIDRKSIHIIEVVDGTEEAIDEKQSTALGSLF